GTAGRPKICAIDVHRNSGSELANRVLPFVSEFAAMANSADTAIRCRNGRLLVDTGMDARQQLASRPKLTCMDARPGPSTVKFCWSETIALVAAICASPPTTDITWALAIPSPLRSPINRSMRRLKRLTELPTDLWKPMVPNLRCAFLMFMSLGDFP